MKLKQEKIIFPVRSAFKAIKYSVPYFDMSFHHHPEFELVYIVSGTGTRNIGASVHRYKAGDMVFIGPDLAHVWMSPKVYFTEDSTHIVESIVVQFSKDLLTSMLDIPEFLDIKTVLERAHLGIKVGQKAVAEIAELLEALLTHKGVDRILELIKILDLLSRDNQQVLLNTPDILPLSSKSGGRINAVHQFVLSCSDQNISSRDAARLANMDHASFCRLFKSKTQKTFTEFLNETRIDQACQQLLRRQKTVTSIAYDCGYKNLGHFYKQFKRIMAMTPQEYVRDSEN